jgi:bacteriocin-like protein
MARKPKTKITKIKIEKLPKKKDDQLSEEELKKVSGGLTSTKTKPLPPIDCWQK